jgi:hypothetical protein
MMSHMGLKVYNSCSADIPQQNNHSAKRTGSKETATFQSYTTEANISLDSFCILCGTQVMVILPQVLSGWIFLGTSLIFAKKPLSMGEQGLGCHFLLIF